MIVGRIERTGRR